MSAKFVVAATRKGGQGKTTIMQNLAVYMSKLPNVHKILMIDLDSQKNLTSDYMNHNINPTLLKNSCIYRAYEHDAIHPHADYASDFKPVQVQPKIWLMAGSEKMDGIDDLMTSHHMEAFKPYVLLHMATSLGLGDKFDYILLDCHGDFSSATQQAIVVANKVLVPVTPSRFGVDSIPFMRKSVKGLRQHLINPATNSSFVTCKLLFVGNMIKWNTRSSHDFLNVAKNHPDMFKANFPMRELFNRATTSYTNIYNLASSEKGTKARNDKQTIEKYINPEFDKLVKAINE